MTCCTAFLHERSPLRPSSAPRGPRAGRGGPVPSGRGLDYEFASTEGSDKMPGRRGSSQEPSWFEQALAAFQEALELVDRNKDPRLYGMILHDIADVHATAGDLQVAAASYRDAVKYKRLIDDPGDLAPTLVALGTCLIRADEPTEARSTLDQAKELLSNEGSKIERRLRAIRLQELGRAYEQLGDR